MEQVVAQQWVQQQGKRRQGRQGKEEVTHEEMLTWYQAHLKDFEHPAKARWEELMVSFARHPNRDEAYAAVAAHGQSGSRRGFAGRRGQVRLRRSHGPAGRSAGLDPQRQSQFGKPEPGNFQPAGGATQPRSWSRTTDSTSSASWSGRNSLGRAFWTLKRRSRRTSRRSALRSATQEFVEELRKQVSRLDGLRQCPARAEEPGRRGSLFEAVSCCATRIAECSAAFSERANRSLHSLFAASPYRIVT